MQIYFACSITGGRQDEAVYQQLVKAMLDDGHEVPTAILADTIVVHMEENADPDDVYARDVAWIRGSHAMVAEVSTPSHGVGYEIGYALALGKPVLCLHHAERKVSKMITGNPDPNLHIFTYESVEDAIIAMRMFLDGVTG
jgi:nucleoside 2-deoxyribosyltransferase